MSKDPAQFKRVKISHQAGLKLNERQINYLIASGYIDPTFYCERYNLSIDAEDVIDHFIRYSARDRRSYSAKLNAKKYLMDYPDVENSGLGALLHYFTEGQKNGYIAEPHNLRMTAPEENLLSISEREVKILQKENFIDPEYYRARYRHKISNEDVLRHFVCRSSFDGRSYSGRIDSIGYLMSNPDIVSSGVSPTQHYAFYGNEEKRASNTRWKNFTWIPSELEFRVPSMKNVANSPSVAIHLHIYYRDYVDRFLKTLSNLRFEFDILISTPYDQIIAECEKFKKLDNVKGVTVKLAKNRGRNFAPLLVDYGKELLKYDLVLHLHSKKSLYTGEEQLSWAQHNITFLGGDPEVVHRHINILQTSETIGLLGLVPFYKLPHWGNHSLKNDDAIEELSRKLDISLPNGFLNYPLGGMMWFKPRMFERMLSCPWSYDDFPDEDGQSDGTMHHALERCMPSICQNYGGDVVYYEPWTDRYALNRYDTFAIYRSESAASLISIGRSRKILSSDIFDTLIYRRSMDVEIGKRAVGSLLASLQLVASADDFIAIRNTTEWLLREENSFRGDIDIREIYDSLAARFGLREEIAATCIDLEFGADLRDQVPRLAVVSALNEIGASGSTNLIFTSDTYYTEQQIRDVIRNSGIIVPYELFISSAYRARKDTGEIWDHILSHFSCQVGQINHIGDNIVSDIQIPTEKGIGTYYIMHPLQKFTSMLGMNNIPQELLWGIAKEYWLNIAEEAGADPFFSQETE